LVRKTFSFSRFLRTLIDTLRLFIQDDNRHILAATS
jgi:hypothetical protein